MIEQCTLDPKIIWRINYNDSKSTFFCKDNCTIKGLELDGVLEEKPHGHFLSWRAEPPFVEQEAHPTEHSFHLSANGCSAEIFPRQPPNILEILVSLVSAIPKDPRLRPGLALFCTCKQTITNCKCWVCPSITFIFFLKTHRSPAVSSWVWRARPVLPSGSDFLRAIFFTAEQVPISGLPIIWRLSC